MDIVSKNGNLLINIGPKPDGTITDEELIAATKTRLPKRLWVVAEEIYTNWIYNLPEMEGMRELIAHIKNDLGLPVYLLSNISWSFAERSGEIEILRPFDKCIFSAVYGVVKPSRDIYDILCRECGILPEETLFIDDSQKNIDGAKAFGISGYLFDGDTARLCAYIDGIFKKS